MRRQYKPSNPEANPVMFDKKLIAKFFEVLNQRNLQEMDGLLV
jgi:hypothetical protein